MAIVSDDFERASLGSNWENGRGLYNNMEIFGSSDLQAEDPSSAANACTWIADSFNDNQFSEGTLGQAMPDQTNVYAQVHVRMQPTTSECYLAVAQPNGSGSTNLWLEYNDGAGGFPQLASKTVSGTPAVGDTLRIEAEGTTLRLYWKGNLELTHVETTYNLTSGDVAIGASRSGGGEEVDVRWESWQGGDLNIKSVTLTDSVNVVEPGETQTVDKLRAGDRVATFTDAAFIIYTYGRLASDSLTATDQYIMTQKLRRDLIESADLNDFVNKIHYRFNELVDLITTKDKLKKTVTRGFVENFRNVVDEITVSDSIDARFVGINNPSIPPDTVDLLTAEFIDRFRARSLSEQVDTITELLLIIKTIRRRDRIVMRDNVIVTRSAILNSAVVSESINIIDYLDIDSGTLLGPSVEVDHGIENQ